MIGCVLAIFGLFALVIGLPLIIKYFICDGQSIISIINEKDWSA
jgi:hypothetical protein